METLPCDILLKLLVSYLQQTFLDTYNLKLTACTNYDAAWLQIRPMRRNQSRRYISTSLRQPVPETMSVLANGGDYEVLEENLYYIDTAQTVHLVTTVEQRIDLSTISTSPN